MSWVIHPMASISGSVFSDDSMKTILKTCCAALVAACFIVILSGCSSMQHQAGTSEVAGLMCDKCQSIWVPSVDRGGKPGTYHVYRASRKMICPQCESMAATYFRTGKFSHSCSGCSGNVTHCTAQVVGGQSAAASTR
jgi:hypothetical protein